MKRVAVIGAGICGLSTAIRLQAADPSLDITIFAETFSPETTSDGAAGFWEPVFMRDTPIEDQKYDHCINVHNYTVLTGACSARLRF